MAQIKEAVAQAKEQVKEKVPLTNKVSIIISKGNLEGVYPGLIMAYGARMEGLDAQVFFTFFGLNAIHKKKSKRIRVWTVGNGALGIPHLLTLIPGFSFLITKFMEYRMKKLEIPPIPRFIQILDEIGVKLYACKATVDMMKFSQADFFPEIDDIISVGEFYEKSRDAEVVFT